MKKKRVFYYFMNGGGGGSDQSLFYLVKYLDKEKFQAYVYFKKESYLIKDLEKFGAITILDKNYDSKTKNNFNKSVRQTKRNKGRVDSKLIYYLYSTPKLLFNSIPEIIRILKLIRELKIDIIHGNHNLSNDRAALIAGYLLNKRVISHYRGLRIPEKIDIWLSRFADTIICISEFTKKQYVKIGVGANKCVVIHNGIDLSEFNHQLNRVSDKFIIANVGRLEEWKGQHILIESIPDLAKIFPNVKFWVVGKGSQEENLKKLTASLNVEEFVEFKGFVKDIPKLLAKVDILVHTAIEPEPFGRVIIEGMAAGLPVIATNIGGPKEIIEDGVDGFLVEPENFIQLKLRIEELLRNKELRFSIAEEAAKKIKLYFNSKIISNKIERYYE